MKRIALLFAIAVTSFAAQAQLTLTGTSYTQNFNSISPTLPTGWFVYKTATATSLGTDDGSAGSFGTGGTAYGSYWDTLGCPTDVFGSGFKNCASANTPSMSTASCLTQQAATDRSLGVRQSSGTGTHPGYDPGASFALELANTTTDSAFTLSFKLQTLDSSCPRVTNWVVDYGIGAAPTVFTPITTSPATLSTGGYTFGNTLVTATLPAAVNKQSGTVWIRVSALGVSTNTLGGNGDRTTSAIDDFSLTWLATGTSGSTGIANVSAQPVTTLTVLGQSSSDKIALTYSVEECGAYSLNIFDMTGHKVYSELINAQVGAQPITVNGLHLAPGIYIAKMNNSNSSSVARIAVQ